MKIWNLILENITRIEETTDNNTTLYNRAADQIIYCGSGYKCRANYIVNLGITLFENISNIENIIGSYFTIKGENATEKGLIKYIQTITGQEIKNVVFFKIEKYYAATLPSGSVVVSDPITIIPEKDNINTTL